MQKRRMLTGIVIRQALDKSSPVFTNSPDLIVTGAAAAFDPSAFIDPDAYRWYFSQAPVPGSQNSLYIRGVNYTPSGRQQSRVYLYWVTGADLLDPAKWQSTGFTVDGAEQNHVGISAISQYQYVMASLNWTPPPATNTKYFLISWIDDSADPKPPEWPTVPFGDLAALGQYVRDHPAMAVLDTVYQGAFLRQFPGQTAYRGGTGAKTSPDLIVTGASAAKDAAHYTQPTSYNSSDLHAKAALGVRNFVYVRAINTTSGPVRARVYLYSATTSNLSPPGWSSSGFSYAGQTRNWVDLIAAADGDVMVSTVPLVWFAPAASDSVPVLIAYVDSSANPQPPDLNPFGYVNPEGVARFVAGQPQLTWLALTGQAVPVPTLSWDMELAAGTGSNSFYTGVQLSGIPADGTLSLSVPGPDANSTIVVESMPVPNPDAFVSWPVTYPDDFRTSAVLRYMAGTTPPGKASIVAEMVPRPPKAR